MGQLLDLLRAQRAIELAVYDNLSRMVGARTVGDQEALSAQIRACNSLLSQLNTAITRLANVVPAGAKDLNGVALHYRKEVEASYLKMKGNGMPLDALE